MEEPGFHKGLIWALSVEHDHLRQTLGPPEITGHHRDLHLGDEIALRDSRTASGFITTGMPVLNDMRGVRQESTGAVGIARVLPTGDAIAMIRSIRGINITDREAARAVGTG